MYSVQFQGQKATLPFVCLSNGGGLFSLRSTQLIYTSYFQIIYHMLSEGRPSFLSNEPRDQKSVTFPLCVKLCA